jgi:type I restriction enzyme, S subunit
VESQQKKIHIDTLFVPEGWEVKTLGELGTFSKGAGITKDQLVDKGLPCIRYGEIYTTHDYLVKEFHSFIPESVARESKRIFKNDILFAGSGETLEEIGKSVTYTGEEQAYAGGDIIIFSPNEGTDSVFLSYFLTTDFANRQKRKLGQGHSVVHIYPYMLKELKVLSPPLKEQKRIREILLTWNRAIELTEKLIEMKEKQKRTFLTIFFRPVAEWIKLIDECELITKGSTPTTYGHTFQKYGVTFIKIESLREDGSIVTEKLAYISEEAHASLKRSQLKRKDILFSIAGALGRVCWVDDAILPANTNQALGIIRLKENSIIEHRFLYYYLQSPMLQKHINEINVQAAQANLSLADLNSFLVPRHEKSRQASVSGFLDLIDRDIQLSKRLLCQYRSEKVTLMHALCGVKRVNSVRNVDM